MMLKCQFTIAGSCQCWAHCYKAIEPACVWVHDVEMSCLPLQAAANAERSVTRPLNHRVCETQLVYLWVHDVKMSVYRCRQLPMLSALLQGRAQFTFTEVRSRNHILLYTHVLGLVDLLQPLIFQPQYSTAFESLLHAYFDLLLVCNWMMSS